MAIQLKTANFNGVNGSKFQAVLSYDVVERNASGMYFIIRYYLYFKSLGYSGSGATVIGRINGTQVGTCTSISANENKLLGTLDKRVNASSDGSFPGDNYNFLIDTPWSLGDASGNGTLSSGSVPAISAASTLSCPDGVIGKPLTFTIHSSSSSYRHIVRYNFGTSLGVKIVEDYPGGSYTWAVPTSLYSQIPNAKDGDGTIYVETYLNGNKIGQNYPTPLKLYANSDEAKPYVTGTIVDSNSKTVALTGNNKKLIKYMSNAKIDIEASPLYYSTIKSYKGTCGDGKSGSSESFTLNGVSSGNFTLSAIDSRGYEGTATKSLTMVNYIRLTENADLFRASASNDNLTLSISGNYFNGSFGATNNSLTVQYRYREIGGSYSSYKTLTATIGTGNTYNVYANLSETFDYRKSYEFEVVVSDKLDTKRETIKVGDGKPMLGLFKNRIENFGTDTIINDNDKVMLNVDLIYPVGSIYMSINSTNPSEYFGGTWVRWGNGRVPVGVNESDGSFNTSNKSGGSNTQELRALIGAFDNNSANIGYHARDKINNASYGYTYGIGADRSTTNIQVSNINHSTTVLQSDGEPPTTIQKYITCYMWRRTA